MCYDRQAALRPIPHNFASLTVYFTRRKWKPNTARRKRSWTSLLRTWRVSNIFLFQHDHYTAMSIPGCKLESSVSFEERLLAFINTTFVVSTLSATG